VKIKRLLKKYKYPPDKQPKAVKTVMEQAELMCQDNENSNVFNYEEYRDRESLPKVAEDEEETDDRDKK
ncbi:unnamed protein product, partial [marine sediment metagenome]